MSYDLDYLKLKCPNGHKFELRFDEDILLMDRHVNGADYNQVACPECGAWVFTGIWSEDRKQWFFHAPPDEEHHYTFYPGDTGDDYE